MVGVTSFCIYDFYETYFEKRRFSLFPDGLQSPKAPRLKFLAATTKSMCRDSPVCWVFGLSYEIRVNWFHFHIIILWLTDKGPVKVTEGTTLEVTPILTKVMTTTTETEFWCTFRIWAQITGMSSPPVLVGKKQTKLVFCRGLQLLSTRRTYPNSLTIIPEYDTVQVDCGTGVEESPPIQPSFCS